MIAIDRSDRVAYRSTGTRWKCRCQCGVEKTIAKGSLVSGLTQSCGCYGKERRCEALTTHGHSPSLNQSSEYRSWTCMLTRCSNPHSANYPRYGGKGITVCQQWQNFSIFLADMGLKPTSRHTIDRIDNAKGYSPDNCRWATSAEQSKNRKNTVWVDVNGAKMCLSDACRHLGLKYFTEVWRIRTGRTPSPPIILL